MLNLGETFPNAKLETTVGTIDLYEYFGDGWAIVFSHPKDFTPVCTTELARLAQLQSEFESRGVKTICVSVDPLKDHKDWVVDVCHYAGCEIKFPLIADASGDFSKAVGMLDANAENPLTVRAVFIIGPEKKVRAVISYPASTGRNFHEILRVIDSMQSTDKLKGLVTPVEWKVGDEYLVKPGFDAPKDARIVPLPSGKEYIKFTKGGDQ